MKTTDDVVVIGGGLGGLACATWIARTGRSVTLMERAKHLGGRARSTEHDGFVLNLGPHALYRSGPAERGLADLGVRWTGAAPPGST